MRMIIEARIEDSTGEQLKLEAALGNTLAGIARNLLCSGSSRFRHFSHFQVAVQHGYPNLNEQVCPLVGSAHLPLFCAPQAHDFIDGRFGDTAADGHTAPIPPSVVDKVFAVGFQVPIRSAKIPPQRGVRRMFGRHPEHVVDALDSLDGFGTLTMPRQPFCRRDFVLYRTPVGRQQVRKLPCRLFDRAKFHCNMKPVQNAGQWPLGSIDRFFKLAGAV